MKNKIMEKFSDIWERLRKNRRLQILLIVSLILIIVVCYFLFKPNSQEKPKTNENTETSSYAESLESKLETALLSIDNVSKVNVLITLETGFEYIYAMEEQTKSTASGSLTTTTLALISGQPVILKEIYPKVKGVVVVSKDACDIKTRLNILSIIQTVLEITNDKITIIS